MTHKTHITLPNSLKAAGPLRPCSRCKQDKPPEGGVSLTPTKWCCFGCWRGVQLKGRTCTA